MDYDLNICRLRKFYPEVTETWNEWKEKPKDSRIRLGTLGEPTGHPEFLDILDKVKPKEYITNGRILGTPGDPRQSDHLEKTIKSGSSVILLWSNTKYCKRAYHELKSSGVNLTLGIEEDKIDYFWEHLWEESGNYLIISDTPKDLKDRKNIKIIEYYQNIILNNKKIIITENSINLKPLKVYDRV